MQKKGGKMYIAGEEEELFLQVACLERQLEQIAREWSQIGQGSAADQELLKEVQERTAQIQALLATARPRDTQVQQAFTELVIIGQIQAFLLEQTIQGEALEGLSLREKQPRYAGDSRHALGPWPFKTSYQDLV
jgi:hypothetical protein